MNRKNNIRIFAIGLIFLAVGIAIGLIIGSLFASDSRAKLSTLRLSGYKWISPLLACDLVTDNKSVNVKLLSDAIEGKIAEEKSAGKINVASVYYRDLKSGEDLEVNKDEKYYPASLNKIPVMIAYFKAAESDPKILTQKIQVDPGMADTNSGQEILPKEVVQPGGTYTILEMIEKMIIYSDNNAFFLLNSHLKEGVLESTYKDLNISFPADMTAVPDFVSAKDFSYFFRVLRNSTYLTPDLSEKALGILSQTDFKEGLVSGVAEGIDVVHKFGLRTDFVNGDSAAGVEKRELHDCGYIYHKKNPYLLCVMTKSNDTLAQAEEAIKNISAAVYSVVESK